jgi:hypothetical protein
MANPNFGRSTVATVLRRERAVFADNLRRCRDVHQTRRYEQIIAEFDATIASLEQTPAKPELKAVA